MNLKGNLKLLKVYLMSFIILGPLYSFAFASGQYISYDDFLSFPEEHQEQTILLVHSFLIENEHQWKVKELTSEKRKKYQSYLKIMNYFINSAHAETKTPMDLKSSGTCFYGGWISKIVNNRCSHPTNFSSSKWADHEDRLKRMGVENGSNEYKYFVNNLSQTYDDIEQQGSFHLITFDKGTKKFSLEKKEGEKCNGPGQILCNPQVYGLVDKAPLCVSGNSAMGINSSFACSKGLESLKETAPKKYKEAIQSIIAQGLKKENKTDFLFGLKSMYDSCLCAGPTSVLPEADRAKRHFSNTINKEYAELIYSTRTCYGILNQTQLIFDGLKESGQISCSTTNPQDINTKSWASFLNKAHGLISGNLNQLKTKTLNHLEKNIITEEEREKIFTEDNEAFKEMRKAQFAEYIKGGICPLDGFSAPATPQQKPPVKNDAKAPTFLAKYNADTKQVEVTLAKLPLDDWKVVDKLKVELAPDASKTYDPTPEYKEVAGNPKDLDDLRTWLFDVTVSTEPYDFKANINYNGAALPEKKVTISPKENPKLACVIAPKGSASNAGGGDDEEEEGDDKKAEASQSFTLKITLEENSGIESKDIDYEEFKLPSCEPGCQTVEAEPSGNAYNFSVVNFDKSKHKLRYAETITINEKAYDVACNYPGKGEVEIEDAVKLEVKPEIAACNIKIKSETGEDGAYTIKTEVTPKDLEYKITWLDQTKKPGEEKRSPSGDEEEVVEDEENEDNETKIEGEELTDAAKEVAGLFEKFGKLEGANASQKAAKHFKIFPTKKEKKLTAVLTGTGKNEGCRAHTTFTLPQAGDSSPRGGVMYNSPIQGGAQGARGNVLGGNR